jgi:hypothetical protein
VFWPKRSDGIFPSAGSRSSAVSAERCCIRNSVLLTKYSVDKSFAVNRFSQDGIKVTTSVTTAKCSASSTKTRSTPTAIHPCRSAVHGLRLSRRAQDDLCDGGRNCLRALLCLRGPRRPRHGQPATNIELEPLASPVALSPKYTVHVPPGTRHERKAHSADDPSQDR